MTNAEKFQEIFGYYATEMWAKPEKEFLEWINTDYKIADMKGIDNEITLTPSRIIEEIWKYGYVEEIFLELSRYLISDREALQEELSKKDSTLRLIGKISKDKTVLDILSD